MRARGFTLIELVMVIALTGIIAAIIAVFIPGPIDAYHDQVRRAELIDSAEMALRRIARDVRRAVPNSVRIGGGGTALQVIEGLEGSRYRLRPGPGVASQDQRLRFNNTDDAFNVVGPFSAVSGAYRLVIYNLGIVGADAWAGDDVITPGGTTVTVAADTAPNEQRVTLSAAHQFPLQSPRQRIFITDTVIGYLCTGGQLLRLEQPATDIETSSPTDAGGDIVARDVTGCQFEYDPGTATRSALVTLRITLARDGETVTLMHQLHVDNAP